MTPKPSSEPVVKSGDAGAAVLRPVLPGGEPDSSPRPAKRTGFGLRPRPWTPSLSVVVPCFNEADNLVELLPRLQGLLRTLTPAWEVILVDDGSTDGTSRVLDLWTRNQGFRALQLSRNFGKEAAITAGLDAACGEATVIMDADQQHPPELIARMLAGWQAGYDVVYAVRAHRKGQGLAQRTATRLFYKAVNIGSRFDIPADAGDFRLLDRSVCDAMRRLPEHNRFMKGLYAWAGFQARATPYLPAQRKAGRSSFKLRRLAAHAVDGIASFTTWPLRLVSAVGIMLAIASLAYGCYLVADYFLESHSVPGWTTIVVALMLLSGIQLIALGVLGEYVSRMYDEVKARPTYVVRHAAGHGLSAEKQ